MQDKAAVDSELLRAFEREVLSKAPHLEGGRVVKESPMLDLTQALRDCANEEFELDLSNTQFTLYGKLDGSLPGGSIKQRPAIQIVREAIASGRLRRGQVVFEATSGNFGIALGAMGKLGLDVVVLVSRRLEQGVLDELGKSGVKMVDLEVDVCPAPGVQMDPNVLLARIVAGKIRERFSELGLDLGVSDETKEDIEGTLARQDVINLAKVLARAYGGFCPEQYDNEDNLEAHEEITGPEIDQQLREIGHSLDGCGVVCTFGTGGSSGGLSRYVQGKYGKKAVHLVFPAEGQDVAGIRNKSKAMGLRFYEPERYAGEHEVDFGQARRLFGFMVERGYDIGESSALALYAVVQMVNFGVEGKFVVILADGAAKYRRTMEAAKQEDEKEEGMEVTLDGARARLARYGGVVWTHMGYVPTAEGVKVIANALGLPEEKVRVADPSDVVRLVSTQEVTPALRKVLDGKEGSKRRALLVCMSGNTSLRASQVLESKGFKAQSLTGGITRLAAASRKPLPTLVAPAKQKA